MVAKAALRYAHLPPYLPASLPLRIFAVTRQEPTSEGKEDVAVTNEVEIIVRVAGSLAHQAMPLELQYWLPAHLACTRSYRV